MGKQKMGKKENKNQKIRDAKWCQSKINSTKYYYRYTAINVLPFNISIEIKKKKNEQNVLFYSLFLP